MRRMMMLITRWGWWYEDNMMMMDGENMRMMVTAATKQAGGRPRTSATSSTRLAWPSQVSSCHEGHRGGAHHPPVRGDGQRSLPQREPPRRQHAPSPSRRPPENDGECLDFYKTQSHLVNNSPKSSQLLHHELWAEMLLLWQSTPIFGAHQGWSEYCLSNNNMVVILVNCWCYSPGVEWWILFEQWCTMVIILVNWIWLEQWW